MDPHPAFPFNADPDPAFPFNADQDPAFPFNADPDPAHLKVMGTSLWILQGSTLSLQASIDLFLFSPQLYFEPLKLSNFDFNVDPDPAFPHLAEKTNAGPCGSGSLLVTWSVVSSPPGRRVAETSW